MQALGSIVGPDGTAYLAQYRSGIEALIHLHERDPGFLIACQDRALNRSRSSPAGQQ
jgi:hypothetical protein